MVISPALGISIDASSHPASSRRYTLLSTTLPTDDFMVSIEVELGSPWEKFLFNLSCMTRRISPVRQMKGVRVRVAGGEVKSGSGGRCCSSGSSIGSGSGSGSDSGSGGKYRRLAGRAEGTGHQPSLISRQPGVPRKRRLLLWTTAPATRSIDKPSPHRAGGRGGIASCCGIH